MPVHALTIFVEEPVNLLLRGIVLEVATVYLQGLRLLGCQSATPHWNRAFRGCAPRRTTTYRLARVSVVAHAAMVTPARGAPVPTAG